MDNTAKSSANRFRAWDKRNKEMIDPRMFAVSNQGKILCAKYEGFPKWLEPQFEGFFNVTDELQSDIVLMKSTGLTDKNGKEIFEGDIFQWSFAIDTYKGEVKWWNERAGFGLPSMLAKDRTGFMMLNNSVASQGDVIGNVYENPSLLS